MAQKETKIDPKRLIIDFYDQLVNEIDIHTEKQLENYLDEDLLSDHWNIFKPAPQPTEYLSERDGDLTAWIQRVPWAGTFWLPDGSKKIKDYFNEKRAEMLNELVKAQQENLNHLRSNRNPIDITDHDSLRKELFSSKFCFFLPEYEKDPNQKTFFGFRLIVTDFYMDQTDLELLK